MGRNKTKHSSLWRIVLELFTLLIITTPWFSISHAVSNNKKNLDGIVYVVSNDPVPNGNSILGYRRDHKGNLTPLTGSPFFMGGMGYATKEKELGLPHFGPFDLDQNIIVNPDHTLLFATNGGSDTIAVFNIQPDGGLL